MRDKIRNGNQKQSMIKENCTLKDEVKELNEKLNNNLDLSSTNNKLDIKPIKEEMNKLIELDNACNKRTLNLMFIL